MKGFTLVEFLLVAGIVLMVAGLSLPVLAPLVVTDDLDEATDGLVSTLARAQAEAVRSGEVIYCAFVEDARGSRALVHRTLWGERGENWNPDWSLRGKVLPDSGLPRGMRFSNARKRALDPLPLPGIEDLTPDGRYPLDRDSPFATRGGLPCYFIIFRPDGSAGSEARIGLVSSDGRVRVVRVEAATGAVAPERER